MGKYMALMCLYHPGWESCAHNSVQSQKSTRRKRGLQKQWSFSLSPPFLYPVVTPPLPPSKWSTDVNETHHQWRCLWRKLTDRRQMYSTINFIASCEIIFEEKSRDGRDRTCWKIRALYRFSRHKSNPLDINFTCLYDFEHLGNCSFFTPPQPHHTERIVQNSRFRLDPVGNHGADKCNFWLQYTRHIWT